MKKMEFNQMENLEGGGRIGEFCIGFGTVAAVYGVGVLANWWNPIGWGGSVAAAVIGAGCAIDALR
jgi:hypothetical protein